MDPNTLLPLPVIPCNKCVCLDKALGVLESHFLEPDPSWGISASDHMQPEQVFSASSPCESPAYRKQASSLSCRVHGPPAVHHHVTNIRSSVGAGPPPQLHPHPHTLRPHPTPVLVLSASRSFTAQSSGEDAPCPHGLPRVSAEGPSSSSERSAGQPLARPHLLEGSAGFRAQHHIPAFPASSTCLSQRRREVPAGGAQEPPQGGYVGNSRGRSGS